MTLREELNTFIEETNCALSTLAMLAHVDRSTLYKIKNGQLENCVYKTYAQIHEAMKIVRKISRDFDKRGQKCSAKE